MQITCKICGSIFKSVILEMDKACVEICEQFGKHLSHKHQLEAAGFLGDLQKVIIQAQGIMIVNRFIQSMQIEGKEIDIRSQFFIDNYLNLKEQLIDILGILNDTDWDIDNNEIIEESNLPEVTN